MSAAQPQFDLGGLIRRAWSLFTANVPILLGGVVIIFLINLALGFIPVLGSLAGMAISGPLLVGYYSAVLKIVRGQQAEFGEIFSGFQNFLPAFLAYLLTTIFTVIGGVLCILPGLFVAMIYCLTYLVIVDQKLDAWPAMEKSRTIVMGALSPWAILFVTLIGLNLAGCLACGLGLLVSGPMSMVILALAYEQVNGPTITAAPTE